MFKIRSKLILQKIFRYLQDKTNLRLIKYNKRLKNKLNISTKEYKLYNQIEIEVGLLSDKKYNNSFKIINRDYTEKSFFHIYINNDTTKVNGQYGENIDKNCKIKVKIDFDKKSLKGLFKKCFYIEEINFIKFNRKDIIDISEMFYECKNLIKINFLNFKTDNVKDMSYLFYGCSSLSNINLSEFNTTNVSLMESMFEGCTGLERLNLNNFNTTNVTNMSQMFCNCEKIQELNLSNFNTSNVVNMSNMFHKCIKLIKLNICNFDIKNNTKINFMFSQCNKELKKKIKKQKLNINDDAFKDNYTKSINLIPQISEDSESKYYYYFEDDEEDYENPDGNFFNFIND